MPPLSPEEYSGGRQVKRGDTVLDILDSVQGQSGGHFVFARQGDTVEIIPVAVFREEEGDYEAVSEEDRQQQRTAEEEERQQQEAEAHRQFREWQETQRGSQPSAPETDPHNQEQRPPLHP